MPRAGLSPSVVVELALRQLDEGGADALTLATVAARAGVATPSLYKHVPGLPALRSRVAAHIIGELADALQAASGSESPVGADGESGRRRSSELRLRRMLDAWRGYARAAPRRYAFLPVQPLADPSLVVPGERLLALVADAVAECIDHPSESASVSASTSASADVPASADAVHATRAVRAAVHGFAVLEAEGGFGLPLDLDESFERLVDVLVTGLRSA